MKRKKTYLNRPITRCANNTFGPGISGNKPSFIINTRISANCTMRIPRKWEKMIRWIQYFLWHEKKTWSFSTLNQTTKLYRRKCFENFKFLVLEQRKTEINQTETIKIVHSTVTNCKSFVVLLWFWVNCVELLPKWNGAYFWWIIQSTLWGNWTKNTCSTIAEK